MHLHSPRSLNVYLIDGGGSVLVLPERGAELLRMRIGERKGRVGCIIPAYIQPL